MRGAGMRLELIRFSLLVVLTVALLSVAFRIGSHPAGHSSAPPATPTPGAHPSASAPVTTPSPSTPARTPVSSHPGPGAGAPAPGAPGSTTGPHTLPVTGWDDAVRLGAVAFVLIGGGAVSLRAAGPRRRRTS